MAQIGSWNGYTFEVSSKLIRSFEGLTLKGSCETETKTKNHQKYVKRKNGNIAELTFDIGISALLGVSNVRNEAAKWVTTANKGESDYFYYGTQKLIPAKVMLTNAEISEVISLPQNPDKWVSCIVKVTFKQATDDSGNTSNSGPKKKSKSRTGTKSTGGNGKTKISGLAGKVSSMVADPGKVVAAAKSGSKDKIKGASSNAGLKNQEDVVKKVQQNKDTIKPKVQTTGRGTTGGGWLSKAAAALKK